MPKTFLSHNPQLYKKVAIQEDKQKHQLNPNYYKQLRQKLIKKQKFKLTILDQEVKKLTNENNVMDESLKVYDPSIQIRKLQQQLNNIKSQQQQISSQIKNCQIVQSNTSADQYFIWKKKQRILRFQAKISQLNQKNQQQKYKLQSICEQSHQKIQGLQKQIEQLQSSLNILNDIKQYQEKQNQVEIQDISKQKIINAKQILKTIQSNNQTLNQNHQILSMQFVDGIDSIKNSLNNFYEGTKRILIKQLKKMKEQLIIEQISPIKTSDKQYTIDPLISDYQIKMKQFQKIIPSKFQDLVDDLIQPLDWYKFNWKQFIDQQTQNSNYFQQHSKLTNQLIQNETQINHIEESIHQKIEQIKQLKDNIVELEIKINKYNKIAKRYP